MQNKSLKDIFEANRYNLADARGKSKTWYDQQVLLLMRKRITPQRVIMNDTQALTTRIIPGNLYLYKYDPKLKETLPYYDAFPLVIPWRKLPDGFIGLNFHYLPYQFRIRLLDNLMRFKTNDKMDETTRLKYSWQLIDGVSKYRWAQPCVKRYLYSHIKSPLVKVSSNDWATAMMLPVERFVGTDKQTVFKDSIKKSVI